MMFCYESRANGWCNFYSKKGEQPRLPDCYSLGQSVFKFFQYFLVPALLRLGLKIVYATQPQDGKR